MMDPESIKMLNSIEQFPQELRNVVSSLSSEQLDQPIREGAWTIRQIVHHILDSLMNSYILVKLILTEDKPDLKSYDEPKWAELVDYKDDIDHSIKLLEVLHYRILQVLREVKDEEWAKKGLHDEVGPVTLKSYLKVIADHGPAHLNSIKNAINENTQSIEVH